jgi:hypothetical protein
MPNRAYVESVLQGVPLPATRSVLVKYAERQGEKDVARALKQLPDQRYPILPDVGEALQAVQPKWRRERRVPLPESDLPPGGPAYGVAV